MNMGSGIDKVLEGEGVDPTKLTWNDARSDPAGTIMKYADGSMYEAAPMEKVDDLIRPKVRLLWMTQDPLGAVAAACRIYEGKPTHSLAEITDDERKRYFEDMQHTHLLAPLEFVNVHFFIEGISRSFTHQQVRQRTAVFAQESLRFAVKANMAEEVTVPPSIAELPKHHPTRQMIDKHNKATEELYNYLVANGVPAEDAREYLPHAVSTRLNYHTNLRNLIDHAGNRLCTQAQLHWRDVFSQIRDEIHGYTPSFDFMSNPSTRAVIRGGWNNSMRWQFAMLADSGMFKPACYQMGRCPFKASFDRGCTIRERVDMNARIGRPSSEWEKTGPTITAPGGARFDSVQAIRDEEWELDRTAAFK